MNQRLGYLLLAVVWMSWGISYPMTSLALRSFDVWGCRFFVMALAGLIMLGLVKAQGRSIRVPRDHWRDLVIASTANMTIFQIGMTYGVYLLSPGRTAIIAYTMPLWATLFATRLLGERVTRSRLAALALGLAGLAVLLGQELPTLRNAPLGAALTLLAAVAFGFGTVWMKRRRWQTDLTAVAGWQVLIGSVPLFLIWRAIGPETDWAGVSLESWAAMLYLVLVANVLAYFAWFRVIATFPATVSGIGTLAVPIVGVFASAAIVDEAVGWREMAALALIGSALVLVLAAPRAAADRGERQVRTRAHEGL